MDITIALGLIALVLAYLFSQVRYEEEAKKPGDDSPKGLKWDMIWTYGTKMFLFILCLADCTLLVWAAYTSLGIDTTIITTNIIDANITNVVTNSSIDTKMQEILQPYGILWIVVLVMFIFLLIVWAIWLVISWIIQSINIRRGKNW